MSTVQASDRQEASTVMVLEEAHKQATLLLNNLLDLGLPVLAPQAQFIRENLGSLIDEQYRLATQAMVEALQGSG